MTKHEIIEILEKCLSDYENAVGQMQLRETEIYDCLNIAESFHVEHGFCSWFFNCGVEYFKFLEIIKELEYELEIRRDSDYWYMPFNDLDYFENSVILRIEHSVIPRIEHSLIPRIEHLKRTIKRLKTEIQNDTNN